MKNKKIKKIILTFPKALYFQKGDNIETELRIEKIRSKGVKCVKKSDLILTIDFLKYLEETIKKFGGKVEYK